MINGNNNQIISSVRTIKAKVEFFNSADALVNTFRSGDKIISIDIERVSDDGRFFGFGVCQRLNLHLLDVKRELNFTTDNYIKVYFNDITSFPVFYISEVHRDEETNELSITAYDILYSASNYEVKDIKLSDYTLEQFVLASCELLNIKGIKYENVPKDTFNLFYADGGNFNGNETIREALNDVAEVTQTIYYINNGGNIVFKRLNDGLPISINIQKRDYFSLASKTNRRLTGICYTNELGNDITAQLAESGTTQYIIDNAFIEMRNDIQTIVDNALTAVGGLTINQFECQWRGNYLVEIGDKIGLTNKQGQTVTAFLLDDTISYDGTFKEKTQWSYSEQDQKDPQNPTTIGDAINMTYAKVDKVNQKIDIMAKKVEQNQTSIGELTITNEQINQSVQTIIKKTEDNKDEIKEVKNQVKTNQDATQLKIDVIKEELEKGEAKSVIVKKGFTFNNEGLTITDEASKSDIKTNINEDGMKVYRGSDAVLIANNEGVKAEDLHATTYLIIGNNSRLEDYSYDRTGCFWIGE